MTTTFAADQTVGYSPMTVSFTGTTTLTPVICEWCYDYVGFDAALELAYEHDSEEEIAAAYATYWIVDDATFEHEYTTGVYTVGLYIEEADEDWEEAVQVGYITVTVRPTEVSVVNLSTVIVDRVIPKLPFQIAHEARDASKLASRPLCTGGNCSYYAAHGVDCPIPYDENLCKSIRGVRDWNHGE